MLSFIPLEYELDLGGWRFAPARQAASSHLKRRS
ncbi:hypothetical protein EP837_03622 [Sphingobium sp. EP60837]|nr:hypothetical protein EP837_03622 [Sphingobium sp. EP60837]